MAGVRSCIRRGLDIMMVCVAGKTESGKYAIVCIRSGLVLESNCRRGPRRQPFMVLTPPPHSLGSPSDFHSVECLRNLRGAVFSVLTDIWLS